MKKLLGFFCISATTWCVGVSLANAAELYCIDAPQRPGYTQMLSSSGNLVPLGDPNKGYLFYHASDCEAKADEAMQKSYRGWTCVESPDRRGYSYVLAMGTGDSVDLGPTRDSGLFYHESDCLEAISDSVAGITKDFACAEAPEKPGYYLLRSLYSGRAIYVGERNGYFYHRSDCVSAAQKM